jgi:hypothetical protein
MECSIIDKLRGPKVLDMSIFDWTTSLLGAALLGLAFKLQGTVKWILFIIAWVLFGILAHAFFGINTMFGFYLGINPKPNRSKQCNLF